MSNIHSLRDSNGEPNSQPLPQSAASNVFAFDDDTNGPLPPITQVLFPDFKYKSANFVIICILVNMFLVELGVAWYNFGTPFSANEPGVGPGTETLVLLRAARSTDIANGAVDRLIIPMFLHASVLHLFSNVAFQCLLCWKFERLWGTIRFVLFFMISGIFGFCFSCAIDSNTKVGVSGALMGTIGAQISYMIMNWNAGSESQCMQRRLSMCNLCCLAFFVTMFLMDNVAAGASGGDILAPSGIDNYGHFGGLFAGLLLGLTFPAKIENPCGCVNFPARPYVASVALCMASCACIYGIF